MASLPSVRVVHRVHRAEAIEAELDAAGSMPAEPGNDPVSMSRAQQAARRLREEDAARRSTSVAPPPHRRYR
jgi:hypothetical protein